MATNVEKSISLTALDRQYVKAAIVLYRASLSRAAKSEADPDVVRLRQLAIDGLNACDAKFTAS